MKTTIKGMDAFTKMFTAEVPEKTKTYTPIYHSSVFATIRKEIATAGFKINAENYRCSNDGKIALGTISIEYKEDSDIQLCASFVNSYNKQHAFRFTLGATVKVCDNGMIISDSKFGGFKKVHKSDADILSKGKIAEIIRDAGSYWDTLVKCKDDLKAHSLTQDERNSILGSLFFDTEVLNGMQMNIIAKELKNSSFDYEADTDSAWLLYNHITLALKETHPADWIEAQIKVHNVFMDYIAKHAKSAKSEDYHHLTHYSHPYVITSGSSTTTIGTSLTSSDIYCADSVITEIPSF